MYGVKNCADRRDLHDSRNCLLNIGVSCHLKLFTPTLKALKDCGILQIYREENWSFENKNC